MKPPPEGWPRIASALYYEDAARAIDWLCEAFGFEVRLKIVGEDGAVAHSELTYGSAVVMVAQGSAGGGDAIPRAPSQAGGANTQNLFVRVDDVKAHFARAKAAGARIVSEPAVRTYPDGGADEVYACVDLGGHLWWFAERLPAAG